jgi:UDP-3-O-[3-hydroxymyristoyl] glucosamine N-acyltransferase
MLMKKYDLSDLVAFLSNNESVVGTGNGTFSEASDIRGRTAETLDWISAKNSSPIDYIRNSPACYIICPHLELDSIPNEILRSKTLILTTNPRLLFARIANALFVEQKDHTISSTAVIDADAKIGANVHIGNFCQIGKAQIGDNTVIMDNCIVFDNVIIGTDVLIKPGAQLGLEGFGFVRDENNRFVAFPQLGSLEIENDVEIGPNTCIDKGALSVTKIRCGTKIGAFVKIAHNCEIGESCFIGAQVFIGGSSRIGNYNWIAPGVKIRDQINIGSNSICGLGSVVVKDIGDSELWMGSPARFIEKRKAIT